MTEVELYDALTQEFSEDELADLCFRLDVEYETLDGGSRRTKARSLVAHFKRRGRLDQLEAAYRRARPETPPTPVPAPEPTAPPAQPSPLPAPAPARPTGNPFVLGRPLRADQRLYGRDDELQAIGRRLAEHSSVNVIAERRLGKTSFLNHLADALPPTTPPLVLARVDFHAEVTTPRHFYGRALRELLTHLPPGLNPPPDLSPEWDRVLHSAEADYATVERVLRYWRETAHPTIWPVFVVDEFETLREPGIRDHFPLSFFNGLSALVGADLLSVVIASRVPLADHFTDHSWPGSESSSFPRYFPPLTLPRLDDAAAEALLLQPSDHPLSLAEAAEARAWAAGHPCHLQAAGWAYYEARLGHRSTEWVKAERDALKR